MERECRNVLYNLVTAVFDLYASVDITDPNCVTQDKRVSVDEDALIHAKSMANMARDIFKYEEEMFNE